MLAFLGEMRPVELLVILVIALLLFGYKLPGVARSLGLSISAFKKGVSLTAKRSLDQKHRCLPPAAPPANSAKPGTVQK